MNNSEKECLKIEDFKIGNIYANKTIKDVFKMFKSRWNEKVKRN